MQLSRNFRFLRFCSNYLAFVLIITVCLYNNKTHGASQRGYVNHRRGSGGSLGEVDSSMFTTKTPEDLQATSPSEKLSEHERAIEEGVRQQVERQLSVETVQGRQLTERLSTYFGQPVKLTVSIGRTPRTGTSSKLPFLVS